MQKSQKQHGHGQRQVNTSDGERRYAQQLWQRATVYLKSTEVSREYGHRKVWRHGLEVAIKIKGSQGNRRVEWLKPEHPYRSHLVS